MTYAAPLILLSALTQAAGADAGLPDLQWDLNRAVRDVRAAFCHRTDPRVVWLATGEGLVRSDDEGRTFKPVPAASARKLGLVTSLVTCPADGDVVLMGTDSAGVHLSTDGGGSFRRLAAGEERPASSHVEAADFHRLDPSWRTLLVTHGTAAAGLSVSRDRGATWLIQARDRFLGRFVAVRSTIIAAGSLAATEGRVWSIHRSGTEGFRWEHARPGIRPTEPVLSSPTSWWRYFMATRDGDILDSDDDGRTWRPAARFDRAAWVSFFWTGGPTATARVLAAYSPRNHGLMLSTGRLDPRSAKARNAGLYVGPFVKSGAGCRANANGTVYYIVMNNVLWVGRRPAAKAGPTVAQAWAEPSAVWVGQGQLTGARADTHRRIAAVAAGSVTGENVRAIAAAARTVREQTEGMSFRVLARVDHPRGPGAVKTVTADAFALGGQPKVPLYDDGKHNDGKPADGLFAGRAVFAASALAPNNSNAQRAGFPGVGAVTVTAVDSAGKAATWSAAVAVVPRPARIDLGPSGRFGHRSDVDGLSVYMAQGQGIDGGTAWCFEARSPGPWRGLPAMDFRHGFGLNISGRDTLTFHIRGNVNQELFVQLFDRFRIGADVFDQPHLSRPVALIGGGHLQAVTPAWQQVRIPVTELLPKGHYFLRRFGAGVALSAGEDGKPGRYYLDR
ncbi:MAG: WD40/YVTN/BNR-like repeat-containing protein, partial [Planctomycetota bacterium]